MVYKFTKGGEGGRNKVYERQGMPNLQNIILDYAKEPSFGICPNINLHKPDADVNKNVNHAFTLL